MVLMGIKKKKMEVQSVEAVWRWVLQMYIKKCIEKGGKTNCSFE